MLSQIIVSGLVLGCVYGLIALGYSLIYKASGMMSFTQGDLLTLGAYLGYTFYGIFNMPFPITVLLVFLLMMGLGMLIESKVIRRLVVKNTLPIYIVLATIAISYIIQNGSMLIWGTQTINFPRIFKTPSINIFGVSVQTESFICIFVSFLFMLALHFFMNKTKFGISMRAAAMDPLAAKSLGINVSLATGLTWGISAGLAALAGILVGPIYGVYTTLGATIGRKGFASAVMGGYGNMYGAMVGGVLLGLIETFTSAYLSSSYKDLIAYLILLIFLFVKPTGIFNEKAIQD